MKVGRQEERESQGHNSNINNNNMNSFASPRGADAHLRSRPNVGSFLPQKISLGLVDRERKCFGQRGRSPEWSRLGIIAFTRSPMAVAMK